GIFFRLYHELGHLFFQFIKILCLDDELYGGSPTAVYRYGRPFRYIHPCPDYGLGPPSQILCNFMLGPFPFIGFHQGDIGPTTIDRGTSPTGGGQDQTDLFLRNGIIDQVGDFGHDTVHVFIGGTFWSGNVHGYIAPIIIGGRFFFQQGIEQGNESKTTDEDRKTQPFSFHEPFQGIIVRFVHGDKILFGHPVKLGPALLSRFGKVGVQHGGQGQGHKGRDHYRGPKDHPKLPKQSSHEAFQKDNGQKHCRQGDGDRDDRKENLLGAFDGGFDGVHPLFDLLIDVLGHHNTVVHYQPGGQNNGQKGEHVHGESQQPHKEEGGNQGNRDIQKGP